MNIAAIDLFSSMANETRLRALILLVHADELCVCDLTDALLLAQPRVSRHLALLRETGLVQDRRAGQWVYYRINPRLPAWAGEVLRQAAIGSLQRPPFSNDIRRLANRRESEQCN